MCITVGALKTARTASDDAYRALVKMVNALALVFGEKDYTSFIDYVNTEITHYKHEVLNQKSTSPSTSGGSTDGGIKPGSSSDSSTTGGDSSSSGGGDDVSL